MAREEVVDERFVFEHLLARELSHRIERHPAGSADELRKLRYESVGQARHGAVRLGVVVRYNTDRVIDQVSVLEVPCLRELCGGGSPEGAAKESCQVSGVRREEPRVARVLVGVIHGRRGFFGHDHHLLAEQEIELRA